MKLGLWGARMDNSGLGQQTFEFYKNMHPDKTLVLDISVLERLPERVMKQYPERYANDDSVTFIYGVPNDSDIRTFLDGLDVAFVCESAYNNDFYRVARDMGVKVANQYNYEFFDWLLYPQFVAPDMFIAPSTWNYDIVSEFCNTRGSKHVYLHCPVDREKIKYRHIGSATSFLHIAGRPAAHDRNGTYTFLNAISAANGMLSGIVVTQDKALADEIKSEYPSVKVLDKVENYEDLYKKGSVLVLPRKYGGNCLPMNEALAAGMPVIMSKLSPQADFLPSEWLVAAKETDIEFVPRVRIPVYECSPYELSLKMLWFKSLSSKDMYEQNERANELAESISWKVMASKYREVFEALCQL